jgi:hypothetical protein
MKHIFQSVTSVWDLARYDINHYNCHCFMERYFPLLQCLYIITVKAFNYIAENILLQSRKSNFLKETNPLFHLLTWHNQDHLEGPPKNILNSTIICYLAKHRGLDGYISVLHHTTYPHIPSNPRAWWVSQGRNHDTMLLLISILKLTLLWWGIYLSAAELTLLRWGIYSLQ